MALFRSVWHTQKRRRTGELLDLSYCIIEYWIVRFLTVTRTSKSYPQKSAWMQPRTSSDKIADRRSILVDSRGRGGPDGARTLPCGWVPRRSNSDSASPSGMPRTSRSLPKMIDWISIDYFMNSYTSLSMFSNSIRIEKNLKTSNLTNWATCFLKCLM